MIKANRTTSLLLPFYSNFGLEFIRVYEQVIGKGASNIRLYLGDANYNRSFLNLEKLLEDNIIFVQILEEPFNFDKLMLFMQSHQNYVTDYEHENYKVFVFKLNEPFSTAIKELKQSNYSKMYDKGMVEHIFSSTKDWYLIYADDHQIVRFPVSSNGEEYSINHLTDKWDALNAINFYDKLIISPYYMLTKSKGLRLLLEHIYGAEIPEQNELVTKIKLENEILNYE